MGPQLSFLEGVSNKLLATIIDTAEKIRDGFITSSSQVPENCKIYFRCYQNKSESERGARTDFRSVMKLTRKFFDTCLGYKAADLQDMTHAEVHKDVDKKIKRQ